jgi:hypothetical protein
MMPGDRLMSTHVSRVEHSVEEGRSATNDMT